MSGTCGTALRRPAVHSDPAKILASLSNAAMTPAGRFHILTTLAFLAVGCLPPRTPTATGERPVTIELLRGVRWDYPNEGFDDALPGFHLAGGIGSVALRARIIPEEFVLEIRTTVALPPNLEGFTLQWQDTVLRVTPFADGAMAEMALASGRQETTPTPHMVAQDYFLFSKLDDCIRVEFLPPALQRITGGCRVSWVDWYRR